MGESSMRILITGSGGLLGSKIAELASGASHEVYAAYNQNRPKSGTPIRLDLRDLAAIERVVRGIGPDAIVHAAAMTDVDKCEQERDLALRINYEATSALASAAREMGAFLVYVSTDYVFNGERGFYSEADEPDPVNFYGYTKLMGERAVEELAGAHCIVRASVIYGAAPASGKSNFALWLIDKLERGERASVLVDQYVSPTLNSSLARMILEAVERGLEGLYHMAGAERVSRYEFAAKLCAAFGFDPSLLKPARMADMAWAARRPRDSSLDVSKADGIFRAKPLKLNEALIELREGVMRGCSRGSQ
ncbi:MAG: dTDP-4-dehydrorhamnose reductase [Candidatus Bathyarchaeia archaeon]